MNREREGHAACGAGETLRHASIEWSAVVGTVAVAVAAAVAVDVAVA